MRGRVRTARRLPSLTQSPWEQSLPPQAGIASVPTREFSNLRKLAASAPPRNSKKEASPLKLSAFHSTSKPSSVRKFKQLKNRPKKSSSSRASGVSLQSRFRPGKSEQPRQTAAPATLRIAFPLPLEGSQFQEGSPLRHRQGRKPFLASFQRFSQPQSRSQSGNSNSKESAKKESFPTSVRRFMQTQNRSRPEKKAVLRQAQEQPREVPYGSESPTMSRCIWQMSLQAASASVRSLSSVLRSNEACSPVPWISMKVRASCITTFMSTSAAESST